MPLTSEEEQALASLETRGAEFMKSFGVYGNKRKRTEKPQENGQSSRSVKPRLDISDDEWTGFSSEEKDVSNFSKDTALKSCTPHVVVFAGETSSSQTLPATKSRSRAFMSSKVSKLKENPTESKGQKQDNEDIEDDTSNIQNDALLHRLVHTKLLSGSLNPELNMTPAQRRKALAGRVLELAGDAKLGKGERVVRQEEKKKASQRVRDGMMAKQKERDTKSLDEAKNAGNYHPALKKLFAASSSAAQPRKRDRGLKMGVGRFSGGMLKLTPEEIGSVRDPRAPRGGRGKSGRGGYSGKASGSRRGGKH